jgi:hypothetical protein
VQTLEKCTVYTKEPGEHIAVASGPTIISFALEE